MSTVRESAGFAAERAAMVALLRGYYGVSDPRVLAAMGRVPRHLHIPAEARAGIGADAYGDYPCPIGWGQTISQPFIVAHMTEILAVRPGEKVLEVGTGSGYQAAVLAELGARVCTLELVPALARHAARVLCEEGYADVQVRCADGYGGWPEAAPFDAIIGTCAPEAVPSRLVEQLAEGGRMVLPVGVVSQRLVVLRKRGGVVEQVGGLPVRFVPMVHGPGMQPGEGEME